MNEFGEKLVWDLAEKGTEKENDCVCKIERKVDNEIIVESRCSPIHLFFILRFQTIYPY